MKQNFNMTTDFNETPHHYINMKIRSLLLDLLHKDGGWGVGNVNFLCKRGKNFGYLHF